MIAVLGVTGCGKSSWVKQHLQRDRRRRVLIWDFKGEYEIGHVTISTAELVKILVGVKRVNQFVIAFRPSMHASVRQKQFDLFCRAAFEVRDLTVVVEELKFVTKANWAPAPWAMLTMTGRDRGIHVIGTSTRPAAIDKDFFGNATVIHTGRLVYPDDVRTVAQAMVVDPARIQPLADLEYWERNKQTGRLRCGTVKIQP